MNELAVKDASRLSLKGDSLLTYLISIGYRIIIGELLASLPTPKILVDIMLRVRAYWPSMHCSLQGRAQTEANSVRRIRLLTRYGPFRTRIAVAGLRSMPAHRPGRACLVATGVMAVLLVPTQTKAEGKAPSQTAESLLEQARDHRETLSSDFPGFRSKLVVHKDGLACEGTMLFRPPITLEIAIEDNEVRKSVKSTVRSLLMHRMRSNRSSRKQRQGHHVCRRRSPPVGPADHAR